jgi:hypothetical protein
MAIIDDIQNSERLLDLSNKIIETVNTRKKLLKEISEDEKLYLATVKQQQKLSQDISANADKYLGFQIKSKDLAKQIAATQDNAAKSVKAFGSISAKLENQKQEALKKALEIRKKIKEQTDSISKLDEKSDALLLAKNKAEREGNINLAKNIQNQIRENQRLAGDKEKYVKNLTDQLDKEKNIAKTARETIKESKELIEAQKKEIAFLEENLKIRKQIEKSTGLLGGIAKSLSKLPGIGQYLNAGEAVDEMEKLAASMEANGEKSTSFTNRFKIGLKGASVLAKGLYENLKSPEAVIIFFMKAALTANKQAVELGKQLGYGSDRADAFRERMVGIQNASKNLNVNTASLTQAFGELVKTTGFAYEFTADQLETQIKLTKQVGLTADEAAQVQRFSTLSGKSSEETYRSFVRGLAVTRNQLKVGIDFKSALAEAVKVSGQLAANLGYNPERIARAVVTMKALGTTLEDTKSQAESLLNFESSIENELKAELLTGQALNLERARALALQGDMAGVAQELANQGMTAAKFSNMNMLAQNAYAQSLGTTSDKLAEQLRKREEAVKSGKSLAQINEEEAAQALERQSVQDKFNAAMEKLQKIVGDLLAGPLGSFLDMLSGALNIINYMATPLKYIGGLFLGIYGTMTAINGIAKLIALTEGLTAATVGRRAGFEAASLYSRIAGNAQAAIELSTEGSKLSFKTLGSALEKESLATKVVAYGWALKDLIVARGKALFEGISKAGILAQIAKIPILLGLRATEATLAAGTAAATVTAAEAVSFGAATVWIIAGLAAVMASLGTYMAMRDGVIDPSKGPVMTGGFGSVQLDPNDKAMYGADGKIKVGTDLMGGESGGGGGVAIDLSPVVSALNEVRAAIGQLINKEGVVIMDSVKVGTTQNMNGRYKTA